MHDPDGGYCVLQSALYGIADWQTNAQEKFYSCESCAKSFRTRNDLDRHTRTHTGERPFKCKLCDRRAADKGNVRKHLVSIHKIVEDINLYIDDETKNPPKKFK